MNPTVLDRSFRSLSRTPWVRSRYGPIAAAVVGISGKNALSGVHGTVTTGPSIGTGPLIGMGLCPPFRGLPSRPGVRILRDPFMHPSCTIFCIFPFMGVSISPFRIPSIDSHDSSTCPPAPTSFVYAKWSSRGTTTGSFSAAAAACSSTSRAVSVAGTVTGAGVVRCVPASTPAVIAAAAATVTPPITMRRAVPVRNSARGGRTPLAEAARLRAIVVSTRWRASESSTLDSSGASGVHSRIRSRSFISQDLLISRSRRGADERLADLGAGAVQAGSDGADGDAEGLGNLVVAELFPGDQEQDVSVGAGEPGERFGQRGADGLCGDVERRPFGPIVLHRLGARSLAQTELAGFLAAVLGDQVGGDAVEPGAGVVVAGVVPGPFPERHQECLGYQVVGGLTADPAGQIAVNVRCVAVEERREPVGFGA